MEFYISPQSGQFYMINVFENQWLSVTHSLAVYMNRGTNEIYEVNKYILKPEKVASIPKLI